MPTFETACRIAEPDDFYAKLIEAHRGLSDEASMKLNSKLVLILANQISDPNFLNQAIDIASKA